MSPDFDWSATTWEGHRRAQQEEFMRLPFREKIQIMEDLGEVAEVLRKGRETRDDPQRRGECR